MVFGCFREGGGDGVLMDVALVGGEVFLSADGMVGEASLPDGEFGREVVGEASFNEVHDLRKSFITRREVDVVGHEHEGVEEIVLAVVLQGFEE